MPKKIGILNVYRVISSFPQEVGRYMCGTYIIVTRFENHHIESQNYYNHDSDNHLWLKTYSPLVWCIKCRRIYEKP